MSRLQALLSQLPPLQIPPHTPLFKFEPFPRLPLELRTMIWKRAARIPRLIKVFEAETRSTPYGSDSVIEGHTVNPGVMGACTESREQGLKIYKLLTTRVPDPYTGKAVTIYVNFAADTFLLESSSFPTPPAHVARRIQPRTYTPADHYNLDVKYLERIERLIQQYPDGGKMRLPPNLLKVARIKEYFVCLNFELKDEKAALEDNVHEDLGRIGFEKKFDELVITGMKDHGADLMSLGTWEIGVLWKGDSCGSDLVPAPPTAEQ